MARYRLRIRLAAQTLPGLHVRRIACHHGEGGGTVDRRSLAKIAGGAKMFELAGGNATAINVGERNAIASKAKLKQLGIKLLAEDTGLNYGRTVEIYSEDGSFLIKSVGKPEKKI